MPISASPVNPALALHSLLVAVSTIDGNSEKAWAEVLGAQSGSVEFSLRHSEAVALMSAVQLYLAGGDERLRSIYLPVVPEWYSATVAMAGWKQSASASISAHALRALQGLGVALDLSIPARWSDSVDVQIENALIAWDAVLADSALSASLRDTLRVRLDHLRWVFGHIDLFGSEPVDRAASDVVTAGTRVLASGLGQPLKKRVAAALAVTVVFLAGVDETVDHLASIVDGLGQVVVEVQEIGESLTGGQRQLPAGEHHQLEGGQTGE